MDDDDLAAAARHAAAGLDALEEPDVAAAVDALTDAVERLASRLREQGLAPAFVSSFIIGAIAGQLAPDA